VRKLILALMLSVLLLGLGTAQAATSQLDNVAGSAGIAYYQASAAGDITLLSIQNIDIVPIVAHVVFYNPNSTDILSFKVPLSAYDEWGAAISGDGTTLTVTPQTPCYFPAPNNGCFGSLNAANAAVAGMQRGYIGITIAAGDSIWYGGDGNGDPRNDPLTTGAVFRFNDVIEARTAHIGPANANAFAMNAWMMQGFVNIPTLTEAVAGFGGGWDSIADAFVTMFYNCDADTADSFIGTDDANGPKIDSWEILATNFASWAVIADDTNGGGVGDTFYTAFGSTSIGASNGSIVAPRSGAYWGRYNENPAVGSQTTLVTVFPANSGPGSAPACNLSDRTIHGISCDDNEFCADFSVIPAEINAVEFGPAGIVVTGTSGDFRITASAPLAGFTYTVAGTFADTYPLISEGKFVNVADGFTHPFWGSGHALDAATSEIVEISFQETHP